MSRSHTQMAQNMSRRSKRLTHVRVEAWIPKWAVVQIELLARLKGTRRGRMLAAILSNPDVYEITR